MEARRNQGMMLAAAALVMLMSPLAMVDKD